MRASITGLMDGSAQSLKIIPIETGFIFRINLKKIRILF
jgi:hypothetical protein